MPSFLTFIILFLFIILLRGVSIMVRTTDHSPLPRRSPFRRRATPRITPTMMVPPAAPPPFTARYQIILQHGVAHGPRCRRAPPLVPPVTKRCRLRFFPPTDDVHPHPPPHFALGNRSSTLPPARGRTRHRHRPRSTGGHLSHSATITRHRPPVFPGTSRRLRLPSADNEAHTDDTHHHLASPWLPFIGPIRPILRQDASLLSIDTHWHNRLRHRVRFDIDLATEFPDSPSTTNPSTNLLQLGATRNTTDLPNACRHLAIKPNLEFPESSLTPEVSTDHLTTPAVHAAPNSSSESSTDMPPSPDFTALASDWVNNDVLEIMREPSPLFESPISPVHFLATQPTPSQDSLYEIASPTEPTYLASDWVNEDVLAIMQAPDPLPDLQIPPLDLLHTQSPTLSPTTTDPSSIVQQSRAVTSDDPIQPILSPPTAAPLFDSSVPAVTIPPPTEVEIPTKPPSPLPFVRLCTYNIMSGRNSWLVAAIRALQFMNIDIAILTEVKITQEIYPRTYNGYNIIATNAPSAHQGGVAIAWKARNGFCLDSVKIHDSNLLTFQLIAGGCHWLLAAVYMSPNELATDLCNKLLHVRFQHPHPIICSDWRFQPQLPPSPVYRSRSRNCRNIGYVRGIQYDPI
jgi:hypothetical protein